MSTIATTVYTTEEIKLADGTELTLRPLPIVSLRKFIKAFNGLADTEDEDDAFAVFSQMTLIILTALDKSGEWTVDKVEETLDLETMKHMFKVSGGIDMDAPKEMTTTNPREGDGIV